MNARGTVGIQSSHPWHQEFSLGLWTERCVPGVTFRSVDNSGCATRLRVVVPYAQLQASSPALWSPRASHQRGMQIDAATSAAPSVGDGTVRTAEHQVGAASRSGDANAAGLRLRAAARRSFSEPRGGLVAGKVVRADDVRRHRPGARSCSRSQSSALVLANGADSCSDYLPLCSPSSGRARQRSFVLTIPAIERN